MSSSSFQKHKKFGIFSKTRGEDGERVFTCNIYEVKDGAKVEIRDREKIFQFIGTLPEQMQVKQQKVFKESELKKGFLSQNMRDALTAITSITGATCKIVSVAGGLAWGCFPIIDSFYAIEIKTNLIGIFSCNFSHVWCFYSTIITQPDLNYPQIPQNLYLHDELNLSWQDIFIHFEQFESP